MAVLFLSTTGQACPDVRWDCSRPMALLSGAFHPLHEGHLALAAAAQGLTKMPVAFELSAVNVDKPELSPSEARRRAAQFAGRFPIWLTRAALFADKGALFPGATFVVGADTAARLVAPCYYQNDLQRLHQALALLRECDCRFLVAGRADRDGRFVCLDDLVIPPEHRGLFAAIAPEDFRFDISSSSLRGAGA